MDILVTADGVLIDYNNEILDPVAGLYYELVRNGETINYPKSFVTLKHDVDVTGKLVQLHKYDALTDTWSDNLNYIDPHEIIRANRITSRKIELSGNTVGEAMFDGSTDINIVTKDSIVVSSTQPVIDGSTPNGMLWVKI